MIKLHRLNGKEVIINAELIESIEAVPDTVINLHTGNTFVVRESMEQVQEIILEYKKSIGRSPEQKKEKNKNSDEALQQR